MKRELLLWMLMGIMGAMACVSCSSEKKADEHKEATAKVQSAPYELLVVADKEWLKSGAGQALVDVVSAPIEGLPQGEPNFRVTYIDPFAFKGTFKTYANIVQARIGQKYEKPALSWQRNVYAQPQLMVLIDAPDNESFMQFMAANREKVLSMLNEHEFRRERNLLKKKHSGVVNTQAQKQLGLSIFAPPDVDDIKVGKNFFWASASKQEFRLNVCLYALPLQAEMTLEQMVAARDSVMKVNIPGERDDQWMETDPRTVVGEAVDFNGQSIMSMRGLWDMRNDAMGGPFVCYYYPDEPNNRLVVAEGFVFAPEENKRALIRQLEAALQTVTLQAK